MQCKAENAYVNLDVIYTSHNKKCFSKKNIVNNFSRRFITSWRFEKDNLRPRRDVIMWHIMKIVMGKEPGHLIPLEFTTFLLFIIFLAWLQVHVCCKKVFKELMIQIQNRYLFVRIQKAFDCTCIENNYIYVNWIFTTVRLS